MSLEQTSVLIQLHYDSNVGVILTDSIRLLGLSIKPKDEKEYKGKSERWGIVVESPTFLVPFDAGDQLSVRILENDPDDPYLDCEISKCEFQEFEGSLARILKSSFKIQACLS